MRWVEVGEGWWEGGEDEMKEGEEGEGQERDLNC